MTTVTKKIVTLALILGLMGAGLATELPRLEARRVTWAHHPGAATDPGRATCLATGGNGAPTLGPPVPSTAFDLADLGYTIEEYFLSGSDA